MVGCGIDSAQSPRGSRRPAFEASHRSRRLVPPRAGTGSDRVATGCGRVSSVSGSADCAEFEGDARTTCAPRAAHKALLGLVRGSQPYVGHCRDAGRRGVPVRRPPWSTSPSRPPQEWCRASWGASRAPRSPPAPRRRRRAASRPAGPPVATEATEGSAEQGHLFESAAQDAAITSPHTDTSQDPVVRAGELQAPGGESPDDETSGVGEGADTESAGDDPTRTPGRPPTLMRPGPRRLSLTWPRHPATPNRWSLRWSASRAGQPVASPQWPSPRCPRHEPTAVAAIAAPPEVPAIRAVFQAPDETRAVRRRRPRADRSSAGAEAEPAAPAATVTDGSEPEAVQVAQDAAEPKRPTRSRRSRSSRATQAPAVEGSETEPTQDEAEEGSREAVDRPHRDEDGTVRKPDQTEHETDTDTDIDEAEDSAEGSDNDREDDGAPRRRRRRGGRRRRRPGTGGADEADGSDSSGSQASDEDVSDDTAGRTDRSDDTAGRTDRSDDTAGRTDRSDAESDDSDSNADEGDSPSARRRRRRRRKAGVAEEMEDLVQRRPAEHRGPGPRGRAAVATRSPPCVVEHPAGGQEAAPPRGPRARPPPARRSSPRRSSWPGARPSSGSWSSGRTATAPRSPSSRTACWSSTTSTRQQSTSYGRQRLPGQGAERAAVDGGRLRRHRQGPQRRALRRRGQLRRRGHGRASPRRIESALKSGDSVLVQVTKDPIGHKGARLTSQVSPARPVPGLRARGLDDRHQPQAARHRARPAQDDPQEGRPRGRRRHRAHRRRGRQRGGAAPRRRAAAGAVGGHPEEGQDRQRARRCSTASRTWPIRVVRDIFNEDFTKLVVRATRPGTRIRRLRRARRPRPGRPAAEVDRGRRRVRDVPDRRAARQGAGPQGLAALAAARW